MGLIQHKTDYKYDCSCGGIPEYVGSEWCWKCPRCGANNYKVHYMKKEFERMLQALHHHKTVILETKSIPMESKAEFCMLMDAMMSMTRSLEPLYKTEFSLLNQYIETTFNLMTMLLQGKKLFLSVVNSCLVTGIQRTTDFSEQEVELIKQEVDKRVNKDNGN